MLVAQFVSGLLVTPWTAASQVSLSMGIPFRAKILEGLPALLQGSSPNPGSNLVSTPVADSLDICFHQELLRIFNMENKVKQIF